MMASHRSRIAFVVAFAGLVFVSSRAEAEKTRVTVRVLAKGAKFIGSSMGGVQITIRDADTGDLLAEGVAQGSTGDTHKIMKAAQTRHSPVSTAGAAAERGAGIGDAVAMRSAPS